MRRLENWPALLTQFLHERADAPFAWGTNDCMIFCADAVHMLTGLDLADSLRGTYWSEAGAAGVIANYGSTVEDILETMPLTRKPVGFAKRGDLATYEHEGNICGGVVDDTGRRVALFVEGRGLCRVPLSSCRYAWGY